MPDYSPPIPDDYDPQLDAVWTIPMALAWIAWGDNSKVALVTPRLAWLLERAMMLEISMMEERESPDVPLTAAFADLLAALRDGRVTASGIAANGEGSSIGAHEWNGLSLASGTDDVAGYDGAVSATYTHVRLASSTVLAAFRAQTALLLPLEAATSITEQGSGNEKETPSGPLQRIIHKAVTSKWPDGKLPLWPSRKARNREIYYIVRNEISTQFTGAVAPSEDTIDRYFNWLESANFRK